MNRYVISGGKEISGEVKISGAKNAILPILAATVITGGESVIDNCPEIKDVSLTLEILKSLGCTVTAGGEKVAVNSANLSSVMVPPQFMNKMRSSVIFMGAVLAREGEAGCSYPGGCEIGARPINIHLDAFRRLGVVIDEEGSYMRCRLEKYKGGSVILDFPSVGATENIMMLASRMKEPTKIINAACEPEIEDLQNFLNSMGAKISGAGTKIITVEPTEFLHPVHRSVIPDRIEAATFMMIAAANRGRLLIDKVEASHLKSVISLLSDCGAEITQHNSQLYINCKNGLKMPKRVETKPYPGFPTDAQSQLMAVMTTIEGTGEIAENIFENRFNTVPELVKMGADIITRGNVAIIKGGRLHGAEVKAPDLRGGAALVTAALAAEGETVLDNVCYIDRGYSRFEEKIRLIGGNIRRE